LLRSSIQRRIRQFERGQRRGEEGPLELLEFPPMVMIENAERRPTRLVLKTRIYRETEVSEKKATVSSLEDEEETGDEMENKKRWIAPYVLGQSRMARELVPCLAIIFFMSSALNHG
jgi:hypothetical protein